MWGTKSELLAVAAVLAIGCGLPASPSAAAPRVPAAPPRDYTAAWWRTIGTQEKFGFILGIDECQILTLHRTVGFSAIEDVQIAAMDKYAEVFYPQYPKQSVVKAWEEMAWTKHTASKKDVLDYFAGSEDYEFWNQSNTTEYHRGFLEGHIACREQHGPLRWSKPLEYYLAKFDHIYDPNLEPAPADSDATIAAVLTKLADPAQP